MAADEADDELYESLLEMLESDLSEGVILTWLDKAGRRPGLPTASQLIELQEAGASEQFLTRLLDLAATQPPAPPAAPASQPPPRPVPPAAAPPPQVASPSAAPAVAVPVPPAPAADGEVAVEFTLLYSPVFDEDEDEWGLYAYLDGELLTYVPPSQTGLLGGSGRTLRILRRLPAGRHVLRLLQERHVEERGRWRHYARAAAESIDFELRTGTSAQVDVRFRQRSLLSFSQRQPLSLRFEQDSVLEEQIDVGGEPAAWPKLCEELEADAAGRKRPKPPKLEGCVRWASLWPGFEVPDRDQVRRDLAALDYRPVARETLAAESP